METTLTTSSELILTLITLTVLTSKCVPFLLERHGNSDTSITVKFMRRILDDLEYELSILTVMKCGQPFRITAPSFGDIKQQIISALPYSEQDVVNINTALSLYAEKYHSDFEKELTKLENVLNDE